jgi:hypothetical protein
VIKKNFNQLRKYGQGKTRNMLKIYIKLERLIIMLRNVNNHVIAISTARINIELVMLN